MTPQHHFFELRCLARLSGLNSNDKATIQILDSQNGTTGAKVVKLMMTTIANRALTLQSPSRGHIKGRRYPTRSSISMPNPQAIQLPINPTLTNQTTWLEDLRLLVSTCQLRHLLRRCPERGPRQAISTRSLHSELQKRTKRLVNQVEAYTIFLPLSNGEYKILL